MLAAPEFLVARPRPSLVPVEDRRGGLRAVIASLARGGAERIVLEWLGAEAARGRDVELAVLHSRHNAWRAPPGVRVIERGREVPRAFVQSLAAHWRDSPLAVGTHLVEDDLLQLLWDAGLPTIPTVHNAREGWRNDPACWNVEHVPRVIACAARVAAELVEAGCRVPIATIRHVPSVHRSAFDRARREALRCEWNVDAATLLVGTVGSFKPQKDFPRAIEILAALRTTRAAALAILGGVLDSGHLGELERTLDAIAANDLAAHVKLPGFVEPIAPWYGACDVLLCASRFEGLSMAAREALAAGLPVVSLDVGGQAEIAHERLRLLAPDSTSAAVARELARHPVRDALRPDPLPRAPRIWSVASAWRTGESQGGGTLLVTANLNAGGAQRSLVNLAAALAPRHSLRVAACAEATHDAFARALATARISCFRPAGSSDPFALAESLLLEAQRTRTRTLCFWNADPRVKLLVAKFAPRALRLVDASPGAYAFEEMERERPFAATITASVEAYYERLDTLVLKHHASAHPACRDVRVIPNGVEVFTTRSRRPPLPRFLASGRIAPSKRLETVVAAFELVLRESPGAGLDIVGQAEPRHARLGAQLLEAARDLPIRFRGAMPGLEHLAEDFTATIVLGTHQGCPNAVLEAMAAGIPVIANASGGTGELVRRGETGWLLAEDAGAEEVARAMLDCMRSPAQADAMAERARERVGREFSLGAMASRYLECFGDGLS